MDTKAFLKIVLLLTIVSLTCANECSEGLSKYFLKYGKVAKDSEDLSKSMYMIKDVNFTAFGHQYPEGIKIVMGKGASFGSLKINPKDGTKTPGSFEFRASRVPYKMTADSYVGRRITKNKTQMKKIAAIINEAYPCATQGNFLPVQAYVGTYLCMQTGDVEDTFQVIVATDNLRMYVIANYHTLAANKASQFGILDSVYTQTFKLTEERQDTGEFLIRNTNGLREGLWVYDVTDDQPVTPPPCGKMPFECTVTSYGLVGGFGDVTTPMMARKELLAKSTLSKTSQCNFQVYGFKTGKGQLKYTMVKLGNNKKRFARTYLLDNKKNKVLVRGLGVQGAREWITFPHNWSHGGTDITIAKSTTGYVLTSSTCTYQIEFLPRGEDPQLKITVGNDYTDSMMGLCDNFDGVLPEELAP